MRLTLALPVQVCLAPFPDLASSPSIFFPIFRAIWNPNWPRPALDRAYSKHSCHRRKRKSSTEAIGKRNLGNERLSTIDPLLARGSSPQCHGTGRLNESKSPPRRRTMMQEVTAYWAIRHDRRPPRGLPDSRLFWSGPEEPPSYRIRGSEGRFRRQARGGRPGGTCWLRAIMRASGGLGAQETQLTSSTVRTNVSCSRGCSWGGGGEDEWCSACQWWVPYL